MEAETTVTESLTMLEMLTAMFNRQAELMEGFRKIEQLPAAPLPLHAPHAQRVMKDFAWRFTEELVEAHMAWLMRRADGAEFIEELSDATHFMLEMLIFAGITPKQCCDRLAAWPSPEDNQDWVPARSFWTVTFHLGQAMNVLKNKPWKQRHSPTDEGLFRERLLQTFVSLCCLWSSFGQGAASFHGNYFSKSQVVQHRQETGY